MHGPPWMRLRAERPWSADPRLRLPDRPRIAAVLVAAVALLLIPIATPVALAADGLRVVADTTYVVDPDAASVHVAIDLRLTNEKPDSASYSYFYDEYSLPIPEEATGVSASDALGALRVTLDPGDGYTRATVRFRSDLFNGRTLQATLRYELPGGPPRSDDNVRVGKAYISFYLWAFGDDGRGSVRVSIPSGFTVEASGDALERSTVEGSTVLSASGIAAPYDWWAGIDGSNDANLLTTRIQIKAPDRAIVIRSWPEDEPWRARVSNLLLLGIPVLEETIGLPWPVSGDVPVKEVQRNQLEGYAGIYYTDVNRIDISEDLDGLTILHEASHAWFNGDLFVERWITEGLADTYGAMALRQLEQTTEAPVAPSAVDEGRVLLGSWRFPGRIDDDATERRETYGYNTAWWIISRLVDEIGVDGMQAVLAAAAEDRITYVGAPAPETVAPSDDWRRLLDLLELNGSRRAAQLFSEYVLSTADLRQLDTRSEALAAYRDLEELGGSWLAPILVRRPLSDWRFDDAQAAIVEAQAILEGRDEIAAASARLGLTPPAGLEQAYETATRGFNEPETLLDDLGTAVEQLTDARAALDTDRDLVTTIGLIGETPEDGWTAAATAFEAGDLDGVEGPADGTVALIEGAPAVAAARLAAAGGVGGSLVLLVLAVLLRRRKRARAGSLEAAVASAVTAYGTLPAEPPGTSDAPGAAEQVQEGP